MYRLLIFLRNVYPIGYSLEGLRHHLSIEIFTESQLREIEIGGWIRRRDLSEFEKEHLGENFKKFYPEYVITNKGIEFINSVETQRLNKTIKRLTIILVFISIGLLIFSFAQNLISLWF